MVESKTERASHSGAHRECVEATSETREAMVTCFHGDNDHSGANFVNDGVLATVVGKTTKQEWIKYHSIEMKL